jgi:hypothetical protein
MENGVGVNDCKCSNYADYKYSLITLSIEEKTSSKSVE